MFEALFIGWKIFSGAFMRVVSTLFTFFTTKPGVYVGAALLAFGILYLSHHTGYKTGLAQRDREIALYRANDIADAYKNGLKFQANLDKNVAKVAYNAGVAKGKEQAKTVTLIKKVPQYVPVETDRNFPVPCGLVRLHDAGALGVAPEDLSNPSGLADGNACPLKASDLATVIVENYGIDHVKDAQIIGLQDLVKSLKAAIENNSTVPQ